MVELLRESKRERTLVELTVSRARFACCGVQSWHERDYEATYVGRVAGLDDRELLLFSGGGVMHAQLVDVLDAQCLTGVA